MSGEVQGLHHLPPRAHLLLATLLTLVVDRAGSSWASSRGSRATRGSSPGTEAELGLKSEGKYVVP